MSYDNQLIAHKLRRWDKYLRDFTLPAWDELPRLDLYMDQVIALLNEYLGFFPRLENGDRVVTATAINNYVRLKIMPAPVKKKYSRIHIAYLIMICSLKQVFAISYVQKMIPMGLSEDEVKSLYNGYVCKHKEVGLYFIEQVRNAARPLLEDSCAGENEAANLAIMVAVAAEYSELLSQKLLNLQGIDYETGLAMEQAGVAMPEALTEKEEKHHKPSEKKKAKPKDDTEKKE